MAVKLYKHSIIIECDEKDAALVKAIADKYAFTGEGIRAMDNYFNNFTLMVTPMIKKFLKKIAG